MTAKDDALVRYENYLKQKAQAEKTTSLLGRIKRMTGDKCLLIDLSGSMLDHIGFEKGALTKYQIMQETLNNIEGFRRFGFSNFCNEFQPSEELPPAGGSTRMDTAFQFIKAKGIKNAVLVTDGMPDSESAALRESAGLKIDILYIGPQPCPKFLEDLAKGTGGSFENIQLLDSKSSVTSLTTKIKGLLT